MNLESRINACVELGEFLSHLFLEREELLNKRLSVLRKKIIESEYNNGWFTNGNILFAFKSLSNELTYESFKTWTRKYDLEDLGGNSKNILLVVPGNIPLVGMHDIFSVIMCGYNLFIKFSSDDSLSRYVLDVLKEKFPFFKGKINYVKNINKKKFDAVIATGSDNSARYFQYYFKSTTCLIRKNRRSIAVLSGNESDEELVGLADDIFLYFGLGCRNVSKLFLPRNYNIDHLSHFFNNYKFVINHKKYFNNYNYHRSIYLIEKTKTIDNGFLIMKEDQSLYSPISVLYYSFYDNINDVNRFILENGRLLQCVVSSAGEFKNSVSFGKTQSPSLSDYADGIDTIDFLSQV